ncbi:glycosyltransferase family A protein [Acaryochloris sp. IP29b_bin.137]|uniref:glycosyltransferase family 2 protein n=1 Tax=Acaryochloris sp. IP29b_bin.137 TaxID=2969217 RepID=UPI002618B106|nr:glycosyltransferase family A protein [Acaryochloris sp. IP29b_bin.137]
MPKVSVIIPAYNVMRFLPSTVNSVLEQTFKNFELIIIDDGSSDHIVQWSAELVDPRIKFISQENKGAQIARNVGIENAVGEYIALLDADDLWEPTKLEKQVSYLERHSDIGVVYTWTGLIDERGNSLGRVVASQACGNVWEKIIVRDDILCSNSVALIRSKCFDAVGYFDPDLEGFQDWDMGIRLAYKYQFGVVKEVLTFYRHRSQSMSRSRSMEGTKKTSIEVIEKSFKSVPDGFQHLKRKSYSCVYLSQGWMQIDQGDAREALRYLREALSYHFPILFSEYCTRLVVAISMVLIFGPGGYEGLRKLTHNLRLLRLGINKKVSAQ